MPTLNTIQHEDSVNDFTISSDFTGSDGTGRTYTVANAGLIRAGLVIIVDGYPLGPSDFSVSSDTITFNVYVSDSSSISIDYYIEETISYVYSTTTTLEVIRTAGIGREVENELLGTGDTAQKSYDTDNGNIINGSYTLKYGAASGNSTNDLTDLTETTDYTIDINAGTILLTATGLSTLGTNKLYISYTHSPKMSDTQVEHMITRAEAEVELFTGNYWGTVKSTTETHDGREEQRYPETDLPYVYQDYNTQDTLQLKNKGVASITSVTFYDRTRQSSSTIDSTNYTFNANGRLVFFSIDLPVGKSLIDVVYTHGYSSPPVYIKTMTELIAAIMCFTNITGGSYDDATRFTLGRKEISIGEVYVNVAEVVRQLERRLAPLLKKIGSDLFVC